MTEAPENSAQLALLAMLREPFPPEVVGKLPRVTQKDGAKSRCQVCGGYLAPHIHLDYVGHAEVTDRLLTVDPLWQWEPLAYDDRGLPLFERDNNNPTRLWIKLTICGVTRIGVGSVDRAAFDAEKQLIGDAIRNAAMRFGVALDLWAKEDLESSLPASGVDASTGEIVGGGSKAPAGQGGGEAAVPPASPPAPTGSTRRPPPGRARAEKGDPQPGTHTSPAGSTKNDPTGPEAIPASSTITPAALDSLRSLALRKGLDDTALEKMAGKEFGLLGTLTEAESQALTQQVVRFKPAPGEAGVESGVRQ